MLLVYWGTLANPLMFITQIGKQLSDQFIEAERTLAIMRTQPGVQNKAQAPPFCFNEGDVQFNQVNFSYDGKKKILQDVCLSIPAGQTLALVGRTGSGKSTALKLISRFYDITNGAIRIYGQDIRDVDMYSLRDRIGVVPQLGLCDARPVRTR